MSAIVNVVLPIFGLILAGYVCRRSGRLGEAASNEEAQCGVCLTKRACTTVLECGHATMCVGCARDVVLKGNGLCPDCRAPIIRVIKTFR